MRVSVKGGGDEWQKLHAKKFAKWFVDKYLPVLHKEIFLTVNIIGDDSSHQNIGSCLCVDSQPDPRNFLVTIMISDTISKRDFIASVGHELVHMKQYALNELQDDTEANQTVFCGKQYSLDMEYWDMPWEIEANGMERGLIHRYSTHAGFYSEVVKHNYD